MDLQTMKAKVEIKPARLNCYHKQGDLTGLTKAQITKILGIKPTEYPGDGDDGKVLHEWQFKVFDDECAIWDWKGSSHSNHHSTYGPNRVFQVLFGTNYGTLRY